MISQPKSVNLGTATLYLAKVSTPRPDIKTNAWLSARNNKSITISRPNPSRTILSMNLRANTKNTLRECKNRGISKASTHWSEDARLHPKSKSSQFIKEQKSGKWTLCKMLEFFLLSKWKWANEYTESRWDKTWEWVKQWPQSKVWWDSKVLKSSMWSNHILWTGKRGKKPNGNKISNSQSTKSKSRTERRVSIFIISFCRFVILKKKLKLKPNSSEFEIFI